MREETIRKIIREELAVLKVKEIPVLLTPEEVANLLGIQVSTLSQWRSNGKGPRYTKKCGIRYSVTAINEFLEED